MGVDDPSREGGMTRRVLAWPPKSSGEAEGTAKEGASHPRPPALSWGPRKGHRGGLQIPEKWLRIAPHPRLERVAQTLAHAGRRLSRRCGPTPDPTLLEPLFIQSKQCPGTSTRKLSHCALGTRGGSRGVWLPCSGRCQEVK